MEIGSLSSIVDDNNASIWVFLVTVPYPSHTVSIRKIVSRSAICNVFPDEEQFTEDRGHLRGFGLVKIVVEYAAIANIVKLA
jgi:hypothetical protein